MKDLVLTRGMVLQVASTNEAEALLTLRTAPPGSKPTVSESRLWDIVTVAEELGSEGERLNRLAQSDGSVWANMKETARFDALKFDLRAMIQMADREEGVSNRRSYASPCPFCARVGSDIVLVPADERRVMFKCVGCGAQGPASATAGIALGEWNRRMVSK